MAGKSATTKTPEQTRAEQTQEAWGRIRDEAGEGVGSCSVFRLIDGKRDVHVGNVSVEEIDSDPHAALRRRWGGGDFLVVLRDSGGTYVKGARVRFHLEGKPKVESGDDAKSAELEALERRIDELTKGGGNMELLVTLIQEQGRLTRELVKPQPKDDSGGMVAILGALTPLFQPIIEKMLEKPAPQGTMERLEELQQLMTLAQTMQGPQDGIGVLAKTLGEPIAKLVEARTGAGGAPENGQQPPPTGAENVAPWRKLIDSNFPRALEWAKIQADPSACGDRLLEEVPDAALGPVYEALSHPEFGERFFAAYPAAQPFREWFEVLFRRIASGIEFEELEESASAPEPEVVEAEVAPEEGGAET